MADAIALLLGRSTQLDDNAVEIIPITSGILSS